VPPCDGHSAMMRAAGSIPHAVLFDLDGTLVDTAPDMWAVANQLCAELGHPPITLEAFRCKVSKGGRAMVKLAFGDPADVDIDRLLQQFLERYGEAIAVHSRLFDGMPEVLAAIESAGQRWGVVTNKPEHLAHGVMEGLGLSRRCAVLIGGDTLAAKKPDPLPLREACRRLGIDTGQALYVGDDLRDIVAARAAPMPSIAAGWGYFDADEDLDAWGADAVLACAHQLLEHGWVGARGRD
jgi:N-acetyl-D-muramate 6-phosphate phosphatase